MKLKLKDEPKEWRNFVLVWCAAVSLVTWLLVRKGWAPDQGLKLVGILAALAAAAAVVRPQMFRWLYRAGMTLSFHVGQVMGRVILTVVFFLVVTPMGLLLRLMGKDLLELKRDPAKRSYWKPARKMGSFEQQF
jgi:hypothetical protein